MIQYVDHLALHVAGNQKDDLLTIMCNIEPKLGRAHSELKRGLQRFPYYESIMQYLLKRRYYFLSTVYD